LRGRLPLHPSTMFLRHLRPRLTMCGNRESAGTRASMQKLKLGGQRRATEVDGVKHFDLCKTIGEQLKRWKSIANA
jgi:hypothetical protein